MSLHAQLSPEAAARLRAQQRTSTITSIIISILSVVLIGILLLWILLPTVETFTPEIVSYQAGADEEKKVTKREMTRAVERKPAAPSSSMAKVIAANTTSLTSVPIPDVDTPDPSADFGDGNDFGDGWGTGEEDGAGFSSIPATMRERCSKEDRLQRLANNGGNEQCEEAVMKALRWIKSKQNPDGSWEAKYKVAMTGFSVLAYLGHCETPNSEEFGDSVTRGILYLVDKGMKDNGLLRDGSKGHGWVYEHGIATYALAEAYTFCSKLGINIPNLDTVTKQAGDAIAEGQARSGGWVYNFDTGSNDGDNSVGFWQIQALKACKHTGLWEEKYFDRVIDNALDYLEDVQGSNGAIGYRGQATRSPELTGGGVLAYQMWGKSSHSVVRNGIKYIRKNTEFDWNEESSNLYYQYYNAQAMINRGGDDWDDYNELFRDKLLAAQNEDGSWSRKQKLHHGATNTHMATCLATFMFEVYYRFLPATGLKSR